ncbi:MAG: outer membrane protein assembly factor BamD [Thermosulfidibacteraceae bacterium]|jgi:outer membrane protein assembly factor BamD
MKKFTLLISSVLLLSSCSYIPFIGSKEKPKEEENPEITYKKAEAALMKKDYKEAQQLFKKVLEQSPESRIVENTRLNLAESYFSSGNYEEAIAIYEDYLKMYPLSPNSDYVMYKLGLCYYNLMKPPDRDQTYTIKAIETFKKLTDNYPLSPWIQEAKKKLKECEERLAENDIYVGKFYLKTDQYQSAEIRFKRAIDKANSRNVKAEATYLLCKTYEKKKDKKEAIECYESLIKAYPGWEYVDVAEKELAELKGEKKEGIVESIKKKIKEDLLGIYK